MSDASPAVALVTGAARRIGRAIALDLARHGWSVAVHYAVSQEAAEETAGSIARLGGRAIALGADLADEREVQALVPAACRALGPLRLLVNNASVFEHDTAETATAATWEHHMAVNLRAPFLLCQAFTAQLPAAAEGVIINVVDQRVWNPTPYFFSYTLSKSALWTMTRTLALALAPRVRVNAIGPGPTLASSRQSEAQFEAQRRRTPLGRGPELAEVCEAVRFVLAARSMTGQMIVLDGGQHLGWSFPDKPAEAEE